MFKSHHDDVCRVSSGAGLGKLGSGKSAPAYGVQVSCGTPKHTKLMDWYWQTLTKKKKKILGHYSLAASPIFPSSSSFPPLHCVSVRGTSLRYSTTQHWCAGMPIRGKPLWVIAAWGFTNMVCSLPVSDWQQRRWSQSTGWTLTVPVSGWCAAWCGQRPVMLINPTWLTMPLARRLLTPSSGEVGTGGPTENPSHDVEKKGGGGGGECGMSSGMSPWPEWFLH